MATTVTATANIDGEIWSGTLTKVSGPPPPPPGGTEVSRTLGTVSTNFDMRAEAARDGNLNQANSACTRSSNNQTSRFWGIDWGAGNDKAIGKVTLHGSNNAGYRDDGVTLITHDIYGFTGAVPTDGAGGTLIGTAQFTQGTNESVGRDIATTNQGPWRGWGVKITAANASNLNLGEGRAFTP